MIRHLDNTIFEATTTNKVAQTFIAHLSLNLLIYLSCFCHSGFLLHIYSLNSLNWLSSLCSELWKSFLMCKCIKGHDLLSVNTNQCWDFCIVRDKSWKKTCIKLNITGINKVVNIKNLGVQEQTPGRVIYSSDFYSPKTTISKLKEKKTSGWTISEWASIIFLHVKNSWEILFL